MALFVAPQEDRSDGEYHGFGPAATSGAGLCRNALRIGRQAHGADAEIIRLGRTEPRSSQAFDVGE